VSIKFFDYAWRFLITNGTNTLRANGTNGFGVNLRSRFQNARRRILSDAVFVTTERHRMESDG